MTAEDRRLWREQAAVLQKIQVDLGKLTTVVTGDGTEGHEQRIKGLEDWREGRPNPCPLSREELHKRRLREIALYSLVVAVVTSAVNWGPKIMAWLRGGG